MSTEVSKHEAREETYLFANTQVVGLKKTLDFIYTFLLNSRLRILPLEGRLAGFTLYVYRLDFNSIKNGLSKN